MVEKDLNEMKKAQQDLRKQIGEMEKVVKEKKEYKGYDRERELEDMVKVALRQNKRLADKVDDLMDTLIEASQADGDEAIEKTLTALSRSQIKLMDEVIGLKVKIEKAETVKQLMETQRQAIEKLGKKIDDIEKDIETLPYSSQIENMKKEVTGVNEELKTLESLVMAAPEQVTKTLGLVKNDVDALKNRMENISKTIKKVEEDEAKILSSTSMLDTLQTKISSMDGVIAHIEELIGSGRASRDQEIRAQLAAIEEDIKALADLRSKVDEVSKISSEEKEKMLELLDKLKEVETEIHKMSQWVESYPVGEAQEISFIKQKFAELNQNIYDFKQQNIRTVLNEQLGLLQNKIDELAQTFEKEGIDVKKKEYDLNLITDSLTAVEERLAEIETRDTGALEAEMQSLHSSMQKLRDRLRKSEKISPSVTAINKKIASVEKQIKKERVARPSEVIKIRERVEQAKREIEGAEAEGKPIHAAKAEEIKSLVEDIELPTVTMEHIVPEIREEAKQAVKEAGKEEKPKIKEVAKRIEKLEKELKKHENLMAGSKVKTVMVAEGATELILDEKKLITKFVEKIPAGMEIPLEDIAKQLNIPFENLKKAFVVMQKEHPDSIELKDAGLGAKISGKKPVFIKKIEQKPL
jgi:chromosome segregation ATPase